MKSIMHKAILCLILGLSSLNINAQTLNLGLGSSIAFTGPSFGLQAKVAYNVNDRFHPAVTYTYFIRKNTNYAVDLDARYRLFSIEEYDFSPLGGIFISRLGGRTRIALNAGLFTRIDRDLFDVYIEPKVVIDDVTFFVISGGIYF